MKKLLLLLIATGVMSLANAQSLQDQAVIPVSVSLTSIMRLNITSGGNIEFVFSNMNQYTGGINAAFTDTKYQTTFSVSSSINYEVHLSTEDANDMFGQDNPTATLPLNVIDIDVDNSGNPAADYTDSPLASTQEIVPNDGTLVNAGQASANISVINWSCGVNNPVINYAADRYATTCFLTVTRGALP